MVGKGEVKSSRIFHQCYLKCCKLQNLTPLTSVIPSKNGKVLDFIVDRIKYVDWPPILNALSCDLSLHSVSIKCRQQVKTVLEQIDCERLAKTVNKRSVILTNFMLNNLVEAISQLLVNTTLLSSLMLEGLPMKIPYLNPICETILLNNSLQHLYLPRCLIGDAGCQAVCNAVRCLPNILTLDLSGCELTPLGVGYIAELVKYQKIHRYSENWVHTLRYRLPELDTMAGLRRITLCGNVQIGDVGAANILEVLADDLWIKALDLQNCGLSDEAGNAALQIMKSNTTLVVLDLRHNSISNEHLAQLRSSLRDNERGPSDLYAWLSSSHSGTSADGRSVKSVATKNGIVKERAPSNMRIALNKFTNKSGVVKKEKNYAEELEEQLQEEISHRQQLEELNQQLVEQMKELKHQQMQLWVNAAGSSGSDQSFQASSRSGDFSSSSGSTSSVPIDQNTLSYIQQAFKDIYAFIKNNQCQGQCTKEKQVDEKSSTSPEVSEVEDASEPHVSIVPKRAKSSHMKLADKRRKNKATKSEHVLNEIQYLTATNKVKPQMIERQMGDTHNAHAQENILKGILSGQDLKKENIHEGSSSPSRVVSDSSDTLVCSPRIRKPINPRDALYSSSDEDP
ncbi:protein Cep78 homolog [Leptidea sinapis]|uniref:protein Cep78 homolog n=1 Tax=Leptidea sinapis TaxID=189913 RepID=UPI0021465AD7|nr:protein Cep78 homolog [Leptidea sinapis]